MTWLLSWKGLVAVLVAIFSFVVSNVLNIVRPFKPKLPTNDSSNCKVTDGPWGAEDLVVAKQGWAITGSVDGGYTIDGGVTACLERSNEKVGGFWAFAMMDDFPQPTRLHTEGVPDGIRNEPCFMTHGLYLSNATDRLYAVTHHGSYSSIEIFLVRYSDNGQLPSLKWIRSVTSDTFPNVALNNVVEGASPGELYVTQWIPSFVYLPAKGRRHAESIAEKIRLALMIPVSLLGLKLTKVHRCTFSDDAHVPAVCMEASGERFGVANGIAISDDRNSVFVVDSTSYAIIVFKRQPDSGLLEKTGEILLDHAADNIEWRMNSQGQEELWMGTTPDIMTFVTNDNKPMGQRKPASGGLAVVTKSNGDEWGKQRIMYNHDGTLLSQISAGFTQGGRTFLGSPYAYGILVCENDE